ncbi:helix-turn-helix domain-containing protein [Priestia megaterium]|uniref:helix-turn-helix domain-containing protein n=1 Tax=Priestia megaterium TaxID=1404 RepID=UPI0013E34BD4|nr:helix-turn-helix transcriptional regulator [Priestia megaterium]MCM3542161.1 helix-turn-helix transcriptional regulator [Priestia megaterium]MDI3093995.1 helix-turn-helix transcriptional regulator [Priestia megaterium]MEC1072003.1 helix-turn-helix transcriptional regulator [Priestia megaterium]MED3863597.1 helix-turn-helix transcriptional regulator [Priestia megaterium]MED4101347.1 helix-turn-helix transcriptional regulator [Priestia megaterium]
MLSRLAQLRKEKKWSLQYTADQLEIAKSTYAGYESGYRRPSLEALVTIAELFDTSTDYLLGKEKEPHSLSDAPIELTSPQTHPITVDGAELSQEEIQQLTAFIRAKRQIEKETAPSSI